MIVVTPTITVAIPVMVMLEAAVGTVPVSDEELSAFVTRTNPVSSHVGWARPISVVPNVATIHWIPVAIDPDIIRSRLHRMHTHYARRRRRTNSDPYRNLAECCRRSAN